MKKILTLLTIALSLVLINHSCKPKEEEPGSIYGVVTDKATGEPVKNANVQLRPTGETTLTGNDGRYEFLDVKNGEYSISVSKTGYTNLVDDYVIIVEGPGEALLLPTLSKLLGYSFTDYGTSLVDVRSTGLRRYARIFQREDESKQCPVIGKIDPTQ